MIKKLLLALFLFLQFFAFSQYKPLSEKATVSVFTCGRGNELYSTFGHTAIRIKDSENFFDVVYNYGAFDFRTENFYLKFVKGDLQYFINATSYEDFVFEYQMDQREVVEQTLNLSLEKKQQLFELLTNSLSSEESHYTYKFIDRNCTTKVLDKINESIGKPFLQKVDDKTITYRELFYPYFDNYFWYKLGINIIFGAKTDAKAEKLFLPVELMNSLDKAIVGGKPLVTKKEILVKGSNKLESEFSFLNSIYFIALLLFIIVILRKRFVYFSYLFVLGLLGVFFCFVGLYSFHEELLWNYNALLFNPLFVILPFLRGKWFKNFCITSFVMLVIYSVVMIGKPHLPLMIPFILANGFILFRFLKQYKKVQNENF
ncbi:DUF4105 domain-containing protein [Flavobacterium sp.]|uniref:Lnb N-terminal periplasmic domain-containing protein n=1 Tax=Flavobacterium sp. TaxID=239 RepID=UPI00261DD233|nr:DUF4105 domain-containing protein [Flavobacterium sp.]